MMSDLAYKCEQLSRGAVKIILDPYGIRGLTRL